MLRVGELSVLIQGGRFIVAAPGVVVTGSNALSRTWQHLAVEVGRNDLSLYVDGVRFAGNSSEASLVGTESGVPFVVGGGEQLAGGSFVGLVDSLRLQAGQVYRGAFTPSRGQLAVSNALVAFTFRATDRGETRLRNEGWLPLQASLQGNARVFKFSP